MTDQIDGKAVERLVQLINIGGDHCGMGLASEYPPDYEDEFTEGRADNEEYVRASDYDTLLSERDALQAQVEGLTEDTRGNGVAAFWKRQCTDAWTALDAVLASGGRDDGSKNLAQ